MTTSGGALPAAGSRAAWRMAARPATLGAAVVPVAVGTACAHVVGAAHLGPALAAGLGAVAIQIGTNFANDVFDFEQGADTEARLGPTRVVQAGLLSARQVRRGMVVAFGLAVLAGLYLTAVAGPAVIAIGVASIASGIAYTGGPYPLGYHGLGDVFVFGFFGVVAVAGTAFVQLGYVPALAMWLALPVGALATAILVVNNLRDRHTDVLAGKRTLAVRLGRTGAVLEYVALIAIAFVAPAALAVRDHAPWLVLPLLSLPVGVRLAMRVATTEGAALNPVLVGTGKLLVLHGGLLTLGLALGAR